MCQESVTRTETLTAYTLYPIVSDITVTYSAPQDVDFRDGSLEGNDFGEFDSAPR